jgi:hypothetical protein
MKMLLTRPHRQVNDRYEAGDVIEIPDSQVQWMIAQGHERVDLATPLHVEPPIEPQITHDEE